MAFCVECGTKLPDGAKFCFSCGTPVANTGTGEQDKKTNEKIIPVSQEKMFKCPNCSSSISRLDAVCPYCGAQVSDREASVSVKRFAEQLYEIEKEATEKKGLSNLFGLGQIMEKGYGSKSFNRKISLISSFPIPNTIEEITEFVVLAANSIDVQWGKDTLQNRMYGKPGMTYYSDITLANTWINKLNQAYDKARISFPTDPRFRTIEKIYTDKMKELKRKR